MGYLYRQLQTVNCRPGPLPDDCEYASTRIKPRRAETDMRKVQLGTSGLQAGVLAASLSAPPTASLPLNNLALLAPATEDPVANGESATAEALRAALAAGANLIDTDWITANGHAQEILGRMMPGLDRAGLLIAGKGGPRLAFKGALKLDNSRGNLINQCQDSLFRLKTGYLDLFQLHWPDATPPEQTARGLCDLRDMGLARALGLCNHSAPQCAALHALAPLATASAPFNLLRRRAAAELLPWCTGAGVSFLAADPLCSGILARRFAGDEVFSDADDPLFAQPLFAKACAAARELHAYAQSRGLSGETLAVAWCLRQPGVSVVLCPAQNAAQMQALLAAESVNLPDADWRTMEDLSEVDP